MIRHITSRAKRFLSDEMPFTYHLITNCATNTHSQQYWDACLAATWDASYRNWPTKTEAIAQILKPTMSIIDIGCGTGSILQGLKQRGFANLYGLELSEYAARRLSGEGIAVSKGNFLDIPFPAATFDAAIASEVLEHIIRRRRFLSELARIIKPKGKILIFVPDNILGPIDEPEHVIKYNAGSLRQFLSSFVTVEVMTSIFEPGNGIRSLFAICRNENPSQAQS